MVNRCMCVSYTATAFRCRAAIIRSQSSGRLIPLEWSSFKSIWIKIYVKRTQHIATLLTTRRTRSIGTRLRWVTVKIQASTSCVCVCDRVCKCVWHTLCKIHNCSESKCVFLKAFCPPLTTTTSLSCALHAYMYHSRHQILFSLYIYSVWNTCT